MGLDIEPNWYLLFLLLEQEEELAIMEIAERLRFSHPSIISMVRKMKERGYLACATDKKDSRKQLVRLSKKAQEQLPELKKLWAAGERAISQLFEENSPYLDEIAAVEAQLAQHNFMERALTELSHDEKQS